MDIDNTMYLSMHLVLQGMVTRRPTPDPASPIPLKEKEYKHA